MKTTTLPLLEMTGENNKTYTTCQPNLQGWL